MELIETRCPVCSARLNVEIGRRFLDCDYCGSKFLVQWNDWRGPQLTSFESVLGRVVKMVEFQAADTRLRYIDENISEAQTMANARGAELWKAKVYRRFLEQKLPKAILSRLGYTVAAAALGGFLWLFTIFNLGWSEVWISFLLALGLTYGAWYNWTRWRNLRAAAPFRLRAAEERVEQGEAALAEAYSQLRELQLEQDLCRGQVKSYRHTAGT